MILKNGEIKQGTWSNGKLHGKGKIIYKDKSFFEGNFINNVKDKGVHTDKDGNVFEAPK